MAAVANLSIEAGCTYRARVFLSTPAPPPSPPAPFDLTGCTAEMQIRPSYGSSVVWADLTEADGGLVLGGTAGTVDVFLSASQTASIPITLVANQPMPTASGVYDLVLVLPSGDIVRCLRGTVGVAAGVTLPAGASAPQ